MSYLNRRSSSFWIAAICIVLLILFSGCQHQPVYPDSGSILINSEPDKAEVLIDGQTTHRLTPVKIDGVLNGFRQITLRHNNYKSNEFSLEVRPGQITRAHKGLSDIHLFRRDNIDIVAGEMDLISDQGDIYLTSLDGPNIIVAHLEEDGHLNIIKQIDAGLPQRLITVSQAANKVFVTRLKADLEEEILGIDLLSGQAINTLYLNNIKYYASIKFSPDGSIIAAADSLNKKIVIINPQLCSVTKTINLPGHPTDLEFDKFAPNRIYVTMSELNRFSHIDLDSGQEIRYMDAGLSPGAIFWDMDDRRICFSNRSEFIFSMVDISSWAAAASARDLMGSYVAGACATNNPNYLIWAMDFNIGTLYVPDWIQTSKIHNYDGGTDLRVLKIMTSKDRRYLLVLNQRQLLSVELDL